jgi:hypothetical protein
VARRTTCCFPSWVQEPTLVSPQSNLPVAGNDVNRFSASEPPASDRSGSVELRHGAGQSLSTVVIQAPGQFKLPCL